MTDAPPPTDKTDAELVAELSEPLTVHLPQFASADAAPAAMETVRAVRRMMVERAEAASRIQSLSAERDDARTARNDCYATVKRVWSALGIADYAGAGGKEISEIVRDLSAEVERLKGENAALRRHPAIASLRAALSDKGTETEKGGDDDTTAKETTTTGATQRATPDTIPPGSYEGRASPRSGSDSRGDGDRRAHDAAEAAYITAAAYAPSQSAMRAALVEAEKALTEIRGMVEEQRPLGTTASYGRTRALGHIDDIAKRTLTAIRSALQSQGEGTYLDQTSVTITTREYERFRKLEREADEGSGTDTPIRATGEWQPIETAPKDGTRILLHVAHPADDYARAIGEPAGWRAVESGFWADGWQHHTAGDATHWMPLPAEPRT